MARRESDDIRDLLNQQWDSLVPELFPNAAKTGNHFCVGSIQGEKGSSLVLWRGTRAGSWVDYNGSEKGDAFNLIQLTQGVDFVGALKWAKSYLRLDDMEPHDFEIKKREAQRQAKTRSAEERRRKNDKKVKAKGMFLAAKKDLHGTPVEKYLQGRGINLTDLDPAPRAIRFLKDCYHYQLNLRLPAMVACISGEGGFMAIHRTYLVQTPGGAWDRMESFPDRKGKLVAGDFAGGYIPIQKGKSNRPLKDMPEGESVFITEGIEDALSLAIADPDARIIAGISLGNLQNVWLPAQVGDVILLRDNDWDNEQAIAGFDKAVNVHIKLGRVVRVMKIPEKYGKDVNDMLRSF